jgi:hypothetical protein
MAHIRLRCHTKVFRGYPGDGDCATLELATVDALYSQPRVNLLTD